MLEFIQHQFLELDETRSVVESRRLVPSFVQIFLNLFLIIFFKFLGNFSDSGGGAGPKFA